MSDNFKYNVVAPQTDFASRQLIMSLTYVGEEVGGS
jgi:hypothetical protein